MKTFDEALEIVAKEIKQSPKHKKEYQKFTERSEDLKEKYREIIQEAYSNKILCNLVYTWMLSGVENEEDKSIDPIIVSYLESFISGLVVGIEMTRTDLDLD